MEKSSKSKILLKKFQVPGKMDDGKWRQFAEEILT